MKSAVCLGRGTTGVAGPAAWPPGIGERGTLMAARFAHPGSRSAPPANLHLAVRAANALADTGTPWYRYEPSGVPLEIKTPGVDPVYARFFPRWLSQTHVVGILKPYAHPRGRFSLILPLAGGEPRKLEGAVAACEYAEGMLHAAMLVFGAEIDPTELCGPDAVAETPSKDDPVDAPKPRHAKPDQGKPDRGRPSAGKSSKQAVKAEATGATPSAAKGERLLVIMSDDEEWSEAESVLEQTGLAIERASALGAGLDRLRTEKFRAIITDGAFDDIRLEGVLARISLGGHTGPILVLDFDTRSEQDPKYPKHRVVLLPLTAPEQITDALGEPAEA